MSKKRQENFPIDEDAVKEFIELNAPSGNEADLKSDKYIYINLSMVRMQSAWLISKLLYAKGLSDRTGAPVIVLTWSENPLLTGFFESFGFKHITLDDLCRKNPAGNFKAICRAMAVCLINGKSDALKSMNKMGLKEGLAIYEDILRTSSLSTIRTCRNKVCLKKTLHILMVLLALDKYLKKHKPLELINDDMAYHENALVHLFINHGARVNAVNSVREVPVGLNADGTAMRHGAIEGMLYRQEFKALMANEVKEADELLAKRFKGLNGRDIDRAAFAGKRVLSREELCREYGLDPNKKTVVIMAHTFTDAVFNYGLYPFRDYYDWTEGTLKIAGENESVNWILKPHPTRGAYNESIDSIENMYARLKKDHIFFLNDDVSAESVKNVADALVTIGGNAGAEFACFGIPVVIVGKPYYSGYGYTFEPATYEEYKKTLLDIAAVKPLTEEQIERAKKVFYLAGRPKTLNPNAFSDEFSMLLNERYTKMCDTLKTRYFESNDGTERYNTEILRFITEYFKSHDMKDTEYYKRGQLNEQQSFIQQA